MPEPTVVVVVGGDRVARRSRVPSGEQALKAAAVEDTAAGGQELGRGLDVRSLHGGIEPWPRRRILKETAMSRQACPMEFEPGYRELAPPPALRGALACLWVRVVPPRSPPLRVLPDACSDLIWQAGNGAFVAAPDTGPVLTAPPSGTVYVGARFLPGAGGPALRVPLSELRDLRVELTDLLPALGEQLHGALPPSLALERVAAATDRLVGAGAPDAAVVRAALLLADPRARVETLAGDLGLSQRQLRRRCHAAAGYGPKTLHRVVRFRRFLARLDGAGAAVDLARLALEAGYADRAHLTRECARLSAGPPPAALVRARASAAPTMLVAAQKGTHSA
jgi:AraC-like DNA-binding protein